MSAMATPGGDGVRHDHWIDGVPVPSAGGGHLTTFVPTTCSVGDAIAAGTAADVERAVAAARAAQPAWAALAAGERAALLYAVADVVAADADTFVELERTATGKTEAQARTEVDTSVEYLRYYAGVIRALHGRTLDLGARLTTWVDGVGPTRLGLVLALLLAIVVFVVLLGRARDDR